MPIDTWTGDWLPTYSLMNALDLVDSLFDLWLLYVATSLLFAVFFLSGFFASLPAELEEAVPLDGASPLRTFWSIMLPLAHSPDKEAALTADIVELARSYGQYGYRRIGSSAARGRVACEH